MNKGIMKVLRKTIAVVLCFQLSFLASVSTYAFSLSDTLETFSNSASVENAVKKACLNKYNAQLPFSDQYADLCPILRESELCKNVAEEDQLKCDSYDEENSIEILSFSFLKNCLYGLWNSLEDLVVFIKDAALATVGYIFDGDTRSKAHEALGEYSEVLSNYIALEMDKALEETDSQAKAAMMVAGGLLSDAFSALMGIVENTYFSLGCYHQEARQERLCNIMGDIIMPPVIAFKLIFGTLKFAKYAKKLPADYKQRMNLAPKNAPVLQRRAREITPEEMKGPHIQKLADRMESTMRLKMGLGIAAPQVSEGLRLVVVKMKDGGPVVMGNPRVRPIGDKTRSGSEGCLSLPGVMCSVERAKSVEVSYLNRAGEEVTQTLTGRDAIVIQHELDHLDGILFPFKSSGYFKQNGLAAARNLNEVNQDKLGRWLLGLSEAEKKRLKNLKKSMNRDIEGVKDPDSLTFSLRDELKVKTDGAVFDEVFDLHQIRVRAGSDLKRYKDINNWVKSEAHALYLYDTLVNEGLKKNKDIFRYLRDHNKYFKSAHGTRGPPDFPETLVTYSFEKESSVKSISQWYRTSKYTDDEWFNLPEEERLALIQKATNVKKKPVSYERIMATEKRPHYLGRYTEELSDSARKGYTWELAHKRYEIDLDRTLYQMQEVSEFTGETHSFHAHVVFDLPKDYKNFKDFSYWTKHTNDYLYMRGLEEGLHGNELVNVARLKGEGYTRTRVNLNNKVPTNSGEISYQSHKFFSMGIRKGLYGDSPIKGMEKIGLELRDATRDLGKLEGYMKSVTDSVQSRRWEALPASQVKPSELGLLRPDKNRLRETFSEFTDDKEILDLIVKAEPNASMALQNFDELKYLDYRTGEVKSPSPEKIEKIKAAREKFIDEVKKTIRNLEENKLNGEKPEREIVEMAMRMDLSGWAKEAKISELFEGI